MSSNSANEEGVYFKRQKQKPEQDQKPKTISRTKTKKYFQTE